jgi:hypothetical protein
LTAQPPAELARIASDPDALEVFTREHVEVGGSSPGASITPTWAPT